MKPYQDHSQCPAELRPGSTSCSQAAGQASAPAEEVHGTFRWIATPDRGEGELRINDQDYRIVEIRVAHRLVGWKVGDYEVCTAFADWSCSCPDYVYRRQSERSLCKHGKALRAALRQWQLHRQPRPAAESNI